jgi:sulfur carrier protein
MRRYNARMLTIQLNGEAKQVQASTSVAALLEAAGYAERRVAVEINREIVPKSLHRERVLADGDRVEIVHALGGG